MMINILFGTESGNAELAAEDIAEALEESLETQVADLADTDPSNLQTDRTYIVVCSTYGDGELPASAQPFHEKLEAERPDLSGIRYGMFGLGDSGYTDTYARGSEVLDRLLTELGAVRIGDCGHHDASAAESASSAAISWAREMLAKIPAGVV